jgi:hypothetical protein
MKLDSKEAQRLVDAVSHARDRDTAIKAAEEAFAFLIGQLHLLGDQANGYPRNPIDGAVWQEGHELASVCDRFADAVAQWHQRRGEEQARGLAVAMALQVVAHYPEEIFPRVLRNAQCRESLEMTEQAIGGYRCIVDDFRTLGMEDDLEGVEHLDDAQVTILTTVREALAALRRLSPTSLTDADLDLCDRVDARFAPTVT